MHSNFHELKLEAQFAPILHIVDGPTLEALGGSMGELAIDGVASDSSEAPYVVDKIMVIEAADSARFFETHAYPPADIDTQRWEEQQRKDN